MGSALTCSHIPEKKTYSSQLLVSTQSLLPPVTVSVSLSVQCPCCLLYSSPVLLCRIPQRVTWRQGFILYVRRYRKLDKQEVSDILIRYFLGYFGIWREKKQCFYLGQWWLLVNFQPATLLLPRSVNIEMLTYKIPL